MVEVTKEWKHKCLAEQNMANLQIYAGQLLWCIPEEKTQEEQELYDALIALQKIIGKPAHWQDKGKEK